MFNSKLRFGVKILLVSTVLTLGSLGIYFKYSNTYSLSCSSVNFEIENKEGNVTIKNTGSIASSGTLTGTTITEIETGVPPDQKEISVKPLDIGQKASISTNYSKAIFKPEKCSRKKFIAKTDSLKMHNCIQEGNTDNQFECLENSN